MKRYYVSDIREDLIMANLENKNCIDTFGRYFIKEKEADKFIFRYPDNKKYIIETKGREVIELSICPLK